MENKEELISCAMDFASYVLSKIKGINRIILHGSIPRGDFNKDSDIDLFFDINNKKLEKQIKKSLDNYYKTNKFKEWKLKGIENPISIISGDLEAKEWKDLKRAMLNTGIILYGKYKEEAEKINQYSIISFENIKPEKKRVSVFRKLFGFKIGKKFYLGELEKAKGKRIGKGTIIIPIEKLNDIKNYLHKMKVSFNIYDIWSDSSLA